LAGITKRAQIPFSVWLPIAIAAPTPVSALVHSSTLVTAGVYLLIRFNKILLFRGVDKVLFYVSVLTIFISGLIANFEIDLKKIIALSTLRQLGLIIIILRLGIKILAFYHLLTHAVFKSLLFICAGVIIHLINNNQDIRLRGKLNEFIPFTIIRFYISRLALMGFPFLAGFYSKDLAIEISNVKSWVGGHYLYWLASIAAILTMYYSVRLIIFVFWGNYLGFKVVIKNHAKMTNIEIFLLGFLGLLSVTTGYLFKDLATGFGSNYFNDFIYNVVSVWNALELELIPGRVKLMPLLLSIIALTIAFRLNKQALSALVLINQITTYFENCKWFYNESVNTYLALPVLTIGRTMFEQYEKLVLEQHGPGFLVEKVVGTYSTQ